MKLIALTLAIILVSVTAQAAELSGTVSRIRDGDTVVIEGIPIRLKGVSAPEMKEHLGKESKAFMVKLVMGQRLRCDLDGSRSHDRLVGTCYLGDRDIGAEVIKAGLALDCPRFSGGRYAAMETAVAKFAIKLPGYCRPK